MMNPDAQKIFDAIVKKNPKQLDIDEVKFLHARRPYMTEEHWRVFGDVVNSYDSDLYFEKNGIQKKPIKFSIKDAKIK